MLLIDKIGIGTGNRGKIGRLDNRLVLFEKVFVLCWKLGMNEWMGAKRHRLPLLTFAVSESPLFYCWHCLFVCLIITAVFVLKDSPSLHNIVSSFLPINPTTNEPNCIVVFFRFVLALVNGYWVSHPWPWGVRPNFSTYIYSLSCRTYKANYTTILLCLLTSHFHLFE